MERWHGANLPSTMVAGGVGGGGSTAMSTGMTNAVAGRQSSNANIQAHIASAHAPSNAQANADITKAEIEAKLTGEIASHSHAGGAAGGAIPSTWAVCSTHILTGSTTMQSVTGLSFAVSSARVYRFEFCGSYQAISSATGLALGINGPASPLMMVYEAAISSGLGGSLLRNGRAFGAQTIASPGSSAANLDSYWYLGGVVSNGANAGTLQLQYASEVAGSTISIRAGSVGFLFGPL